MSTTTLPNIRVSSDLTVRVRLKDGGVYIDWSTLNNIKAHIYSDAQRALAGRCDVSVDAEDSTLLVCSYAANKPQYVGINRIVVSAKYMGETKTYDKPAFNFVRWTADQEGEEITIDDPDVDVEIEVEDVTSSILQEAIDAALQAAADAEHAAHLVPLEVLQDCEQATADALEAAATANAAGIDEVQATVDAQVGTPSVDVDLENKVLSLDFHNMKGETGEAAGFGTASASFTEDGGDPGVTVSASGPDTAKQFAFTFKNLKGDKGDKGDQGNTGSSVDYPYELVNNCTTNDATKGLAASQGVALQAEVSQLEAKVDDFATGKYYGTFTSSSLLPEGTIPGFAYIGSENPFEVWVFNGTSWTDSGATMDGTNIPSLNPFKGMYNSLALLETAYPNPQLGDYAYVKNSGTPATANIYNVVSGEWADTGVPVGITDYDSIFTMSAKLMLIQTLGKVAWIDAHGQDYLNELQTALMGAVELDSITAVFNPGTAVITDTTPLEDLMQYLTVTAIFSDLSQEIIYNYNLSGALTAGTNTITVTYLGKTTTFTATAVHNYAGLLSTWTLHPANSIAEYTNNYIRLKCNNTTDQSNYGVWVADAKKTLWSAVNGKTVKVRIKVNTIDSSVMISGLGVYADSSISSMGNAYTKRKNMGALVLADDGYYEVQHTLNIADFTIGTLTPTANSTFGVFVMARSRNTYSEIYDVQIIEVTS